MPDSTPAVPRAFRFRREAGGYAAASTGVDYHDVRQLGRVVKIDGAWQAITPAGFALGEQYPTRLAAARALEVSR